MPAGNSYDPRRTLEAQRLFFQSGKTKSIAFRKESLQRLETVVARRANDLTAALAEDLGKPDVEAYVSEVYFVLSEIRLFVKKLKRWARPEKVGNPFYFFPAKSEIRSEPLGASLIVAPWNYPVQLSLSPLIASVAAGNVVTLKPSEQAPATAKLLEELIREAFQPDHVTVVQGGVEIGEALLKLNYDHWFYTGGESVGRLYAKAAAENLAPCVLELGGKCPCVLDTEIDLDMAAERIVSTKFFNAGQTCIAPDFLLVPESLHDEIIERLSFSIREAYPDEDLKDLAHIISDSHYERIRKLIPDKALSFGSDDSASRLLAPRIIPNEEWDSPAMSEEIFGPVLPVVSYRNLDEALAKLGEMPSPLALYVFSKDNGFLERVASSIRSGSVCFNDAIKQATNLDLPFGGVGASGMGRYRGKAGFDTFSYQRPVTKRYFFKDVFLVKPPYEGRLESLRKILK